MIENTIMVNLPVGLHLRNAAILVKELSKYDANVRFDYDGNSANGKSLLDIVTLCIKPDTKVQYTINGWDEAQVSDIVNVFFTQGNFKKNVKVKVKV